jgi:hypothetical protein
MPPFRTIALAVLILLIGIYVGAKKTSLVNMLSFGQLS